MFPRGEENENCPGDVLFLSGPVEDGLLRPRFVDFGNELPVFYSEADRPGRSEVSSKVNMRMRFKDTAIITKAV